MHLKRIIKIIVKICLGLFFAGILVFSIPRVFTAFYARSRIFTTEDVAPAQVAIVFGAGLNWDGTPSAVLKDRVATAAGLYFTGKVQKLLLSGDNRFLNYNEPGAMREYAIELGVPEDDIVQDFAGRSTYDTCYRAGQIFGVTDAILVTQGYHLPRALYLCSQLGIQSVGVSADLRQYERRHYLFWVLRELPATLNSILQINLTHPIPVLGDPEPIFPQS
jgi:SanA protein